MIGRRSATKSLLGGLLLARAGVPQQKAPQQKAPQDKAADEPLATIKVDVDVVSIFCSVRDKKGGFIGNLAKDDFQVFEDGRKQEIKYFTRESDLPLTIGLLVDVSGSQARLIEEERRAAHAFFSQVLRKKDMAFLISFGTDTELLQDFTNSASLLRAGLDRLRLNAGVGGLHPGPVPTASQPRGTVLFDAVYLAATDRLKSEVGRKVMVVITDGVDQGSRVSRDKAIEVTQKADTIIYSVYYVDREAYYGGGFYGGGGSDGDLRRMSDETGGRVLHVDRKHTLQQIFDELQQEMRTQYAIGYTPDRAGKNGDFRKLEIKTSDSKLKVQARKGYYAISKDSA
jgi:VWFA-related protein